MFDRAWLERALELQRKMNELAEHNWHFDRSWLDKAMEMQKMVTGPGIDPGWYREMLGSIMKGHPGSGAFNFQESGESGPQQAEATTAEQAPSDVCGAQPHGAWQPQFTITETPRQITLTAYIPGIKSKDDISIRLYGSTLYVSGKNRGPSGWQGNDGKIEDFYRAIRLPTDVCSDGTSAHYTNGSLTIKIPKTKPISIDLDFSR